MHISGRIICFRSTNTPLNTSFCLNYLVMFNPGFCHERDIQTNRFPGWLLKQTVNSDCLVRLVTPKTGPNAKTYLRVDNVVSFPKWT